MNIFFTRLALKSLHFLFFLSLISLTIFLISCPAGKIVYFALARYNPDGSIDTTFGKDGVVVTEIKDYSQIYSLAIQSDGKILAAGTSDGKYAVVRYLSDGTIDKEFGKDGKFIEDFGADYGLIKKIIISKDGKILAAGYHSIREKKKEKYSEFTAIRLNSNGTLDSSFGNGGITQTNFTGRFLRTYTIVTQADGKIILAGVYDYGFEVIRYDQNGSNDINFGIYSGRSSINLDLDNQNVQMVLEIMVKDNDEIIMVGIANNKIIKVNFDKDGRYNLFNDDFIHKYGPYFEANVITITPNEDIIIAGATAENQDYVSIALLKLRMDINTEKDITAKTIITKISQRGPDVANAIAVQSDGKIILGGTAAYDFALVRYNQDGSIDNTFGQNGIVTTELGSEDVIQAIAIQPDGKIIVGGYSNTTSGKF